jgi:asparagine synthase (glutamine-hydrolysing)
LIGGYLYRSENKEISHRLKKALKDSFQKIPYRNSGILFFDQPYGDFKTSFYTSEQLTILTQDLLVTADSEDTYTLLEVHKTLPELFLRKKIEVLNDIVSDYRLILIEQGETDTILYLVSNRAGNGRMYYYRDNRGMLFCSDIRFLLKIIPWQVNDLALFSILKYGAIPEPLTIAQKIEAVPVAHFLQYELKSGLYQTRAYFHFKFLADEYKGEIENPDHFIQPAKQKLRQSAQFLMKYQPAILLSGGIDSSLYALYMKEVAHDGLTGINCTFGDKDPEFPYTRLLAEKIGARFYVGKMEEQDALMVLDDAVAFTGHLFSDFSSLPIVFILKYMKTEVPTVKMLMEGNGGDDCFGFSDLVTQSKWQYKSHFPKFAKDFISFLMKGTNSWKWESYQGLLARVLALCDVHEINPINYFLVLTPVNFLGLNAYRSWDMKLNEIMEKVFSNVSDDNSNLSYQAKVTIRQLLQVNSRRWAAKAYSVGESIGIRVIYPYIWRDILVEQGKIPWSVKVHQEIVKWPLKRLLEEYMPHDFIYRPKSGFVPPFAHWLSSKKFDETARQILLSPEANIARLISPRIVSELLDDALRGEKLRHAILNFLWGALFTEMWIKKYNDGNKMC